MEEKRNLQVTISQAREWYSNGGEWKKLALSAFSEDELTRVDYLEYVRLHAPNRRPMNTKVVESKREEMRVLLMLHNLADIMNNGRIVSKDAPGYYIRVKSIPKGAGCYRRPFLDVDSHASIKHPGIAYFNSESDARKALEMLRSELEAIYLK